MTNIFHKAIGFLKQETVLCAAALLAVVSAFFVPPSLNYIGYVDWDTLALLFSLMAVMKGFQQAGVFLSLGSRLLGRVSSTRTMLLVLVFLPFFLSMVMTNDVSLITFVPFGMVVLKLAKQEQLMIPMVVLQTLAANLGSMLTPMGNPQNLYLYSSSGLGLGDFLLLLLPYGAAAGVLLAASTVVRFPAKAVTVPAKTLPALRMRYVLAYLALFALCLLTVAGVLSKPVVLVIVALAVLVLDRQLFRRVDYALLVTFVCFFVFVGNIKRLEELQVFLSGALAGRELPLSVLISQVISNVPAAILLSNYTENIPALLIGTNLGGLGTLIASMASLISWKQIAAKDAALKKPYFRTFTLWNAGFLIVLYLFSCLLRAV